MDELKEKIRSIPDFPKNGIIFRDVTTLFQDSSALQRINSIFYNRYKDYKVDKIAGIEARGFIIGSILAHSLKVGFVPIRKKGKLPYKIISEKYELEYGNAELEIHIDSINKGERVVIVDDLIATGGTLNAAIKLVEKLGGEVLECACIVELPELMGRVRIINNKIFSVITFEGE